MKKLCVLDFAAPTVTGLLGFKIVKGWTIVIRSGFLDLRLNADQWSLDSWNNTDSYLSSLGSLKSCVKA